MIIMLIATAVSTCTTTHETTSLYHQEDEDIHDAIADTASVTNSKLHHSRKSRCVCIHVGCVVNTTTSGMNKTTAENESDLLCVV